MKIPLNRIRSGLSLFEILASMFILMVGLLGVLAVLPFGMYQMNRVNKADFGGNCGRAAIQEIQVRNWSGNFEDSLYDPYENNRLVYDPQTNDRLAGNIFDSSKQTLRCDRPIIVDPLLAFTNNMSDDNGLRYFGFLPSYTNGLPRLTSQFASMKDTNGDIDHTKWNQITINSLKNQVFDTLFWKDDRNFATPASPSVQVPRPVGVTGIDDQGNPKLGPIQSHENYSWLYMLTPQVRGIRNGTLVSESDIAGYDVDVVVFFNRNLDLATLGETERTLGANREGTGYRGGSFTLYAPKDDSAALDLTDTRWLLLSCPTGDTPANYTLFAKWYRIVSFGEIEPHSSDADVLVRRVMLLGPDVPDSTVPAGVQGYAVTLAKGAIHVYSTVIKK